MSSRAARRRRFHRLGWVCLLGAAALPGRADNSVLPPEWFRLCLTHSSFDLDVEGERNTLSAPGSTGETVRERLYLAPTLDLGLKGSVYHPNLLEYTLDAKGGYVWETVTTTTSGTKQTVDQNSVLQSYLFNVHVLDGKPYAGTFFAAKDHTFRDYDFFNRVTVDVERYGGNLGWSQGPVPMTLSFAHLNETDTGLAFPTTRDENTLYFQAYNQRQRENHTQLTYSLDDFVRMENGSVTDQGQTHFVTLTDTEHWGDHDRLHLDSRIALNDLATQASPERDFTDNEHLSWEHTSTLRSFYDYSFDNVSAPEVDSYTHVARAALRHQLYESLTSTFDVHGQLTDASGGGNSQDISRVGLGLEESYVKKLGSWGRLSIGDSAYIDHTDQQTTGAAVVIVREPHTLTDGVITLLNQPNVMVGTIQVTDNAGSTTYAELLDYVVVSVGARTEIQRVPGGFIPSGGAVAVSYQAVSQPSATYQTASELLQVRLDLFSGLVGLYGRLNVVQNYGGESLLLQNLVDKVAGVDVSWKWLRSGAEYEGFNSSLAPYTQERLFQSCMFEPSAGSTLSLDLAESWAHFPQNDTRQANYSFISRYRERLTPWLAVNLEGGIRRTRGAGFDQDLATARAGVDFGLGKLTVKAGYEYQAEDFLGEHRGRNFIYLRAKRAF